MYRARKQRKFLIMGLVGIMLLMSVGYAAFQSNLKIRGTTRITSLWDVRITNVTAGTPTGSATNAVAPTWDKLTANMEANLYEKGDAMEYDVTITNNGTVDAVLSDIIGTPSNNDAVIITYSGYAKGEKLYKSGHTGNQKIVHVKIQYNPEYNGGNASGSSSIQFDFTQGEGGGQVDTDKYLLTYNYTYNGGASSTANDEYVEQNTTVSLSNKTALKPGWTFVGWNTNKDATTGLSNVKVNNNTTVYAIYSKTLTATYEKGEHVDSISKVTDTCTIYNLQTGCTKTLPVITPSAGYTVDTWYNGTIEVGKSGNSYELRSNVTLTTKAEANRYLVTYNYSENGGSSATKTEDNVAYDQNIDLTPTATKLGWTFVGWNTNKDATTKLTSLKMGTENVTLYAIYKKEAITLTAKFNENGSTLSSTEDESCTLPAVYNKETQITSCEIDAPTITAPANTPTIVGFNTAANSTTNNASYNTTTKKITLTEGNDNNTWYAITTKAKINRTITFYRNGNTNFIYNGTTYTNTSKAFTVCSIAATYNGEKQATSCTATLTMPTITAPANTPTIIGWSTRASTRTKSYSSGQENVSISMTGNKKYYAQTTKAKQTFTVTYEKDEGASAIGKVSDTCDLAVTYNGVAQATECSITLPSITASTGYTSDGWYNGNTKIGDSEDTYNISSNVTLTGKTTANVYTVTLDGKGVEQIPNKVYYQYNTTKKINNVTCYYYTDPELTTCITDGYKITPPTKVGYTFGGYYTSADGVGTQYVNASGAFINNVYKTAGDKTLQANWTANEYTINYSLNGGTKGTNAPSNGTYDTEIKIDNPTKKITITGDANGTGANIGSATNANQTFAGWTGTGLGSNAKSGAATGQTTSWNGAATTNTFFQNLNESGAVTLTANWTPVTVKLPTLSKEGYTCKWYTDETAGTELGSGGDNWLPSANSPANITAHARCTANTYTVIFNANGEGVEGTMANQTFTYDEEKNLSENAFTKAGYNFKGWAKSSTGTVEYANKEKVSNLVNSGTINLFAVWEDEDGPVISVTNTAGTTNFLTTAWNGNANATSGLGSFTVLIGATDTGSGINKVEYVINSNTENPSSGWTEIENGTPASASQPFGTYYIHVKATDNDGNISYATTKAMTIRYSIAFKDYATNTSTSKTLYATPSAPTITARTPATKTGYTFLGWYTSASGGTKVTDANVPYTPTKSITLYGHWQKEISDLTVIVADDEYTYDGTAKTPAVTVKDGNTVLTLNTDYTVTYQNNVNAGKGTVTVTMKNVYNSTTRSFYTGTDEYEFTIKKSDTTTSLSEITKTYNGSAQSVTGATSKLSSNSSDITNGSYTYTYYNGDSCSGTALTSAPKNAGIYSVKATLAGTSNYNTSTSSCVKYTINQKKATITVTDSTKELTYKAAGTNTYTYDGDGTVTCESSDTSKVTCSVDTTNKKITVTPVASTTDPVTITVKAGAGTNYSAADNKTFTVTVEKFQPTVNLTAKTGMKWTGNAHAANTATVTLTNSETYSGTITYTYYTNNSCSEGATTTAPTLAGSYWVKASIAAQGNYKEAASSCVAHTIAVATPTVSLTAKTATYSGSAIAANTATVSPNSNPTITYTYYTNSTCTTKTGTAAASGAAASAGAAPKQVGQWYVIASASEVANKTEAAASSCTSHKINQKKATITVQDPTVQLTYGTNDSNTYTYDGDGTVSCQSSDTSKVTCTVDTTNKKIKLTPVALTTTPVTITVKAGAGTNYSAADNKTFTVTVTDGSVPTAEITSTSTLKSTTQTATLKCDDDVGVVSYYWGTTAPTSSSQYETITSTKNMSITKTVNAAGTYYLSCKDSSGNATQTPASKVYNSYTVNNMLQNVSGDTYTTTHYTQTSTNTFIAPNGTNLTTTSIYTVPNGSNQERYVGISEGAASTTEAAVNQTNTTLNENKIISVWFTRNIVKIKYKSNEGTVRASTKASDGTVYTWTTDSDDIINISIDGDAVRQATSSYRYGVSKIDVLNFNNSSYLYISKTGFVGPSGQEWICDSGCTTPNMTIKQSSWTLPVPQGGVSTDTLCDAKNDDCTIVIKVNWKESTTIPTAAKYCNELTYTGEEQTLTKTAGTGYTFSGNSGTNAGEYTVTATLASGHAWSDRGVGVKTFKCSVNKATPVITLSPSALTVGIEDTDTFTATVKSGASNGTVSGTLTVESEANEIASVTPESKTITSANNSTGVETTETVTGVSIGTSTISANFTPDSNSSSNYNAAAVKTITATVADTTVPTVNDIAGGTTLKATSQSLTLKASDNIGITAYYFGTTEPASASAITTTTNDDLTSIQGSGLTKNVTQEGTYWFAVKDAAGNFSKKSIVIRKYQVQNVLETIAASSNTTYTNANYAALNDTKTYYVKDGTTLTLTSSYTKPTGGNTFKGYTTSAPSATAQTPSTTNPKVATNNTTVYYMWFTRLTYTVTVSKPTNGSVTAETVTKTGNSVTASTAASSLTVKYGDTVKATATPNTNCEFESWSGGYVSGSTNPVTGAAVTSAKTITATFKVLPIIKSWGSSASTDFHNSTYRENITSIIFEDSINIPEGATSWDVSAVANSGAVMAWVTIDPEDSSKYVLHIGGDGGVIANVNSSNIFINFTNVKSINFNNTYDTSNVTNMSSMFLGCSSLTSLELDNKFDTSSVTNMSAMFYNCRGLTNLDLGDKFDTSSVTDMSAMFSGCSGLTDLDLGDKFDTSSVTNMNQMYSFNTYLTNLDLGNKFDTSSVTDMGSMFSNCISLTSLDLGDKFDTSNVTYMYSMFNECSSLRSLDLGDKFDTNNVTNMYSMFDLCSSLTSLDLGDKFDTSSVTNMSDMFRNCSSLTNLELGDKFDTSGVTQMSFMFGNCPNLTSLDLGNKFDTNSVTNMNSMFRNCTNIKTIFAPTTFVTTNVTSSNNMFSSDTKLVGGNGTAVATKQVYDKTYAKIDKSGQEGYFTRTFATPKFTEAEGANNSVDVTITFPAACSTDLTCKYKKDDGSYVTVTSSSVVVNFTEAGTLAATVTDGVTTKSASYTVLGKTSMDIVANAGESCEGELVEDTNEPGRYIYRGKNPCNYINIKENGTNVKYRIYSIESDGTMKVIRDEAVTNMEWDVSDATRRKGGYCTSNYCNAWAAMDNFVNGSYSGAVAGLNGNSGDSSIKEYIESTYKDTLDDYSKIVSKTWNISGTTNNRDTLENAIADEKKSTWNGKIALLTASEYVRANTNTLSCGTLANLYSNYNTCESTNYLVSSSYWWLLSPDSSGQDFVLTVRSNSRVYSNYANGSRGVRPSFYLCSGLVYSGEGSENNPYEIAGGKCAKTTYTGSIYRWSTSSASNGSTIKEKTIYNITADGVYGHGPAGDYETLEACESDRNSKYGGSYECKQFDLAALEYTTNPATLGKNYYLKHDVVEDIITASYVCFVHNNAEHCMKGGDGGASFAANTQMIQDYQTFYNLNTVSNPSSSNPGCSFDSWNSSCYGGGFTQVYAHSYGTVNVRSSSSEDCGVNNAGTSNCNE